MRQTVACTLLMLAVLLALACISPPAAPVPVPTPCPAAVCTAAPEPAATPRSARQSPPDPVRDAMTTEMRQQLVDRLTDFVYTAATGDLAYDSPDTMAHHLAAREGHDQCLNSIRQTLHLATDPAQPYAQPPDEFYRQQAAQLRDCLSGRTADWGQAGYADRVVWVRRILQAAARMDDPSEHYRPLLHNENADAGWQALNEEFQQCQALVIPLSDQIAGASDSAAVSAQVLAAIEHVASCNFNLTQIRYPDQPEVSTPPAVGHWPVSPPSATPSAVPSVPPDLP